MHRLAAAVALLALLLPGAAAAEETLGGFPIDDLRVDRALLVAGGPGKDGIKSVDAPEFSHIGQATWVARDTEVLGVEVGDKARAYPIRFLEYHQVVNDEIGSVPVVATYDPLAGVPMAYRRSVGDRELHFGVSGLVYNHGFVLYDRETGSLWSQFTGAAIAGPLAGSRLERVATRQETTGVWVARHVDSPFLRPPFPEKVHYQLSPYQSYWVQDRTIFPLAARDESYHAKELVLGVEVGKVKRAYLGSILTREGGRVEEEIRGKKVRVAYDSETGTFQYDVDEGVRVTEAYWLAWKAFHPDTEVWNAKAPAP
ncbi:MAG: DUF3179 domain-containing (seleno)protein [Myxococcota bacterium]